MKTKLQYVIIVLLLILSYNAQAQFQDNLWVGKQAYNWCFGVDFALDFSTDPPTYTGSTGMASAEGTGTISDAEGNLLFYFGHPFTFPGGRMAIYNKNHEIMQNGGGLIGNNSTSQSGLVVPKPGSSTIYYVFYSDTFTTFDDVTDGFYYATVDMSLDNGLGAVMNKNVLLSENDSEYLSAVYHANKEDVWVVHHEANDDNPSNQFKAFLVTENGVSTTPIVSSAGEALLSTYGQMKISPDGSKLALVLGFILIDSFQVFDFNNSSGAITNSITLNTPVFSQNSAYGLEFSPNSRFLYLAFVIPAGPNLPPNVYQFDLEAGDQTEIINSAQVISSTDTFLDPLTFYSLQLTPQGKIFIANTTTSQTLSVINYPNNEGAAAGFEYLGVDEEESVGDPGSEIRLGLPGFIQSYFESGILHEGNCPAPSTVSFSTIRIPGIESIQWFFGDGTTGTDLEPTHSYTQSGTYTVTAIITSNGAQQAATTTIEILDGANATPPENLVACGDGTGDALFDLTQQDGAILNGQDPTTYQVTYHESQNAAENNIDVIDPATGYSASDGTTVYARVTNTDTGCYAITQFTLEVVPTPTASEVDPIVTCDTGVLDGIASFDLTQRAADFQAGQPDTHLSYHETQAEAENNSNAIADPEAYTNTSNPQTIYVRITTNNLQLDCYAVAELELQVLDGADAVPPETYTACGDGMGNAIFDLTNQEATILGGQDSSTFTVDYYHSESDAINDTNAIQDATSYSSSGETIYVRVTNTDTGCYALVELELQVEEAPITNGALELIGCSPFDLTSIAGELNPEYNLSYFEVEADAEANTNPIADVESYITTSVQETVYLRITNTNGCVSVVSLPLVTGDCILPEGISPNGDGMNDSFDLTFLTATYGGKHISIFNRYGRIVYETDHYSAQWFGQDMNGNELPTATYYYILELNEPHPEYGKVVRSWVYVQRGN